jgi:hypothetical protein
MQSQDLPTSNRAEVCYRLLADSVDRRQSPPLPHPMGRLKIQNKIEILARKKTSNVLLKTVAPVPAKPGGPWMKMTREKV